MSLETLEFVIHPDGRVEETVTGIMGESCEAVTAAIEAQLGRVVETRKTSDFFSASQNSLKTSAWDSVSVGEAIANRQTDDSQW